MASRVANIAVFVSGNGTNLQALLDAPCLVHGKIALVIADKPSAGALVRAKKAGVSALVIPRNGGNFEKAALKALRTHNIDLVVLAGFLGILSKSFIATCGCPIINIHPSLIPAFCGKGFYGLRVHEAALAAGVMVSGATVHYVSDVVDGGAIISQRAVAVLETDTPQTLQRRIMEEAEWTLLPEAAEKISRELVAGQACDRQACELQEDGQFDAQEES